jgi:hypothetical protein
MKEAYGITLYTFSGYCSGNGYFCNDLDECRINNGGCSISPLVQCINTQVVSEQRESGSGDMLFGEAVKMVYAALALSSSAKTLGSVTA